MTNFPTSRRALYTALFSERKTFDGLFNRAGPYVTYLIFTMPFIHLGSCKYFVAWTERVGSEAAYG